MGMKVVRLVIGHALPLNYGFSICAPVFVTIGLKR